MAVPKTERTFKYKILGCAVVLILCVAALFTLNAFNMRGYTDAMADVLKANNAYDKSYWGDAGILYQRASLALPEQAKLQFNLAGSYYKQGRYAESAVIYKKLTLSKNIVFKANVWNNLGNCYYQLNLIDNSYEAYKTALIINNSDDVIRQNFLFIATLVQRLQKQRAPDKNNKNAKEDGKKSNDTRPENNGSQKSVDDQPAGPYHVSDKDMDRLLKISKDQERVPSGSRSNKHTDNKTTTGPDY